MLASTFAKILQTTLHKEIGLRSFIPLGLSTLGIIKMIVSLIEGGKLQHESKSNKHGTHLFHKCPKTDDRIQRQTHQN